MNPREGEHPEGADTAVPGGRAADSVERLVREFLERRREDPLLSADAFADARVGPSPELRTLFLRAASELGSGADRTERIEAADRTELPSEGAEKEDEPTWIVGSGSEGPPREVIDGRYEVVRTLGQGGFGRVHLVRDRHFKGEPRALKVVLPEHSAKPEFAARFQNEIRVLRALSHAGIPQIFNDGRTAQGEFYYTMAFVQGRTLADVLEHEAPLRPDRIVHLMRQLLDVLGYAHGKGVVHRDLKPANIMLVDAGTSAEVVKVLDFGIAKVLRPEGELRAALTQPTVGGIGTPHYMSPEQVRGRGVDERTDLYALGIILYQMCSGLLPFGGKSDLEVATARLEQAPTPLGQEGVPGWLRDVVERLLEREKEKRPSTRELSEQFERLAKGQKELTGSVRRLSWAGVALALLAGAIWWQRDARGGPPHSPPHEPEPASPTRFDPKGGAPAVPAGNTSTGPATKSDEPVAPPLQAGPRETVDASPPVIEWNPMPGEVDELWVHFKGTVVDGNPRTVTIRRDGSSPLERTIELEGGGAFETKLELEEGENVFRLLAKDAAGNVSEERELSITRRVPAVRITRAGLPEGPVSAGTDHCTISGQADRAIQRVTINGEDAVVDGEEFHFDLALREGANPVEIVPYDERGRRGERYEGTIHRQLMRIPAGCSALGAEVDGVGRPLKVRQDSTGITLVLIGEGTPALSSGTRKIAAFYLGETEVTREQYRGAGREPPAPGEFEVLEGQPVVNVSFEDALSFCRMNGLRLPSVDEWEYSARGPELFQYPWGNTWEAQRCRHDAREGPVPVDLYPLDVSAFGVRGLAGNVSEWCRAAAGEQPEVRGGSWSSDAQGCGLLFRRRAPLRDSGMVGFRVALDAP